MQPEPRRQLYERQAKLRESFLDFANLFVLLRMKYLRMTGTQPPEPGQEPKGPRRRKA